VSVAWIWRLRLPNQPMLRHLTLAISGGALLFVLTTVLSSFNDYQVAQIGVYAVALAGLTLLTGANGQISLGNGAFMAVGAYGAGLLLAHTDVPIAVALLLAVAVGAVAGVVIGIPASRLRGPYLAGMTLALAVGLPSMVTKFSSVFGGDQGLSIAPPTPPNGVDPERWLAWIVLLCVVIVLVLLGNLMRSRFGRAFRAVRDDEVAASLVGISVARTQVLAFAVSAGCAGLAGGLFGLTIGGANPDAFNVQLSISLLAGVVLGGTGSLFGVWWGAVLLVYVPQWATSVAGTLNLQTGQSSNLALLFYGVVLVVVMLAAPGGLQGGIRRLTTLFVDKVRAGIQPSLPSTEGEHT
jgi:branched-chain amino acid transport system permease protein